ncbi:hypothetical protein ACHAXR_001874 [Thalassiosira sp. AJA248-18]
MTCQKAHRPRHKKDCKKCSAALFDEALFKQPPPKEDCPICFLQLPSTAETVYTQCCGKYICTGCVYEIARETDICPFCRVPAAASNEERISRRKKGMEAGDAGAFFIMASQHFVGDWGLPQDPKKGLELMLRAVELGSTEAHFNIACIYANGESVEKDPKKRLHHYQRAAMGGCERSRHNLGCDEAKRGNIDRAMKHWMIAVAAGDEGSLGDVKIMCLNGYVTKAEYEKALRAYQNHLNEVQSDQRDRAAGLYRSFCLGRT